MLAQCWRRFALLAPALIAAVSLAGCTPRVVEPTRSGSALGAVNIASFVPQSQGGEGLHATVTLERDGMAREISLEPIPGGFAGEIAGLPVGEWALTVLFFDETGDVTHTANDTVRVYPGTSSLVELEAVPVDATLEFLIDLALFPERDDVGKARISFSKGGTLELKPVDGELYLFHGTKKMAAGDYEYSVGIFGPTFYASDAIYLSPWEFVRLETGKTVQVQWQPDIGGADIVADVVSLPPTPTGVSCELQGDELWVLWDPIPIERAASVVIYSRSDDFLPFDVAGESEPDAGAWLFAEAFDDEVGWIALASADDQGRESFRSEVIAITACSGS